jgi:peptidoglycan/xylan/chitin deacetylase (PgdA/CDA1 family)
MRDAGMAIESHTHTHPFLSELPEAQLRDELRRSRDFIGEELGAAPTMIALPGGDSPHGQLRHVFAEEGYAVVATSRWGVNSWRRANPESAITIQRCTVKGECTDDAFLAIVHADRWLRARKRAREGTLAVVRRLLGPSRYAQRRRALLNAVGSVTR